jgi:hypothetical protein
VCDAPDGVHALVWAARGPQWVDAVRGTASQLADPGGFSAVALDPLRPRLILATSEGDLVLASTEDGRVLAQFVAGLDQALTALAMAGDVLLAGSPDGHLVRLDLGPDAEREPATDAELWFAAARRLASMGDPSAVEAYETAEALGARVEPMERVRALALGRGGRDLEALAALPADGVDPVTLALWRAALTP